MTETNDVTETKTEAADRGRRPGDSDVHRRQKSKNIAVAFAIVGFCILVYIVTLIRMGSGS